MTANRVLNLKFHSDQMPPMCNVCGSEIMKSDNKICCRICGRYICMECEKKENSKSLGLEGEDSTLCCKFCAEKCGQESSKWDGLSPFGTPLICPAISLTSFDSCASNYGDSGADPNLQRREDEGEEAPDTTQQNHNPAVMHLENEVHGKLMENIEVEGDDSTEENKKSSPNMVVTVDKNSGEKPNLFNNRLKVVQDDLEGPDDATEDFSKKGAKLWQLSDMYTDNCIWVPPEPEDKEVDIECSIANNDDDDEYSDGTKWGPSSSLSIFDDESGSNHRFKEEERQKAMAEVMSGNFRTILTHLLNLEGIADDWLDIIASLSWEAATLIKPEANEGIDMDPTRYLKVKCIASGSLCESGTIKGLVFKKNAAHKHMATKYKNPRLLLLQGILGQRASVLSSFASMEEEQNYLKSITEMIETCDPNVVLVEKIVTRDLQESLLKKGITLVFDMKLPRLEKIARCTGSQIISSASSSINPKLKQCDLFHIEKFVEEHNTSGKGGKRTTKTLMFFEGCPKPLGATILLKGAHSDELKKVKHVVQQAVFVAYHLILDTSFFVDQRARRSDNDTFKEVNGSSIISLNSNPPSLGPMDGIASSDIVVPIFKLSQEESVLEGPPLKSNLNADESLPSGAQQPEVSLVPLPRPILPGQLLSSVSGSLRWVLGDNFPIIPSASYLSISSYFGFKEKEVNPESTGVDSSNPSLETLDETEADVRTNQENENSDKICKGEMKPTSVCNEVSSENMEATVNKKAPVQQKDMETVLGSPSILVLHSMRSMWKDSFCKQSVLSRIKYYGYFDMSLGRFLCDFILNQKHLCPTCGEPPNSHEYCYTHLNGKLTVRVKLLPQELHLPGEPEGKLWMWARCLKCKCENGYPKPTERVVISNATRGLSFGKLLELSLANNAASSRLSSCGHSLHRDCLLFYGLGATVAMFNYSCVDIYEACNPPPILEFNNPNGQEWLHKEAEDVLARGHFLFAEVMNSLHMIESKYSSLLSKQPMNLKGFVKEFSVIAEMLKQDKSDFEASLEKAVSKNGELGQIVHQILNLNRLNHELLLKLYVWDRRLHYLLPTAGADRSPHEEQLHLEKDLDDILAQRSEERNRSECGGEVSDNPSHLTSIGINSHLSSCLSHHINNIEAEETSRLHDIIGKDVNVSQPLPENFDGAVQGNGPSTRPSELSGQDHREEDFVVGHLQVGPAVSGTEEPLRPNGSSEELELKIEETATSSLAEISSKAKFQNTISFKLEDPGWVWTPFSETCKAYRKDLQRGYSQKFEMINSYNPEYLSSANQLIIQERSRLHFPVGMNDEVISVYEDEYTSIIASALAFSLDQINPAEDILEKVKNKEKGATDIIIETQSSEASDLVSSSPYWSSSEPSDLDGARSAQTFSSDELSTSGSDGFSPLDPLHPEISLGIGKLPGKGKYSVVCVHAKQFHALRRSCCPSELYYIASLSRCKQWNAQGGKSNVFFAKTMDDRFIVKEVKKTELDSFLKFAPEYFKHISHSLSTGSQTCLAKILGIYQVIVRQAKNGKDLKIDLIVMENLLFGRNVSRLYDLKGALHSRFMADANDPGKTLLDQNFVHDMRFSPFYISRENKKNLERAVWNDTCFLTSINVMDYSLLVGVDKEKRELVFGIIDYLRQYTWDKHLETWVKASLVVPKNASPTVVSPKEYKKRFRKFMSTHFLTVPGWCSEFFSKPFEIYKCGMEEPSTCNSAEMEEKLSNEPS